MPKKIRVWYRRERKRWYGEYWLNYKRFAKAFKRKADALLWQSYMQHKFNYEDWQGVTGLNWYDLTKLYLNHKDAQDIAPTTRVEIINSLKQFTQLVGTPLSDTINQGHIEQFIRERKKNKVSNRTVNKDLTNIKSLYLWSIKTHYARPGIEFNMLKTLKKEFQPPPIDQLSDLFALAKEYTPLYLRMVLALATGIRRSAIERVTLDERQDAYVDIDNNRIVTIETKGRQQIIKPLGPNVMTLVTDYINTLPAGTKKLFPKRWDARNGSRKHWERYRRQVGLPKLTFHNLRNLSVSYLAAQGESAAVLQKHTGHKSFKTTAGYIGVSTDTQERVTMKLDQLFVKIL